MPTPAPLSPTIAGSTTPVPLPEVCWTGGVLSSSGNLIRNGPTSLLTGAHSLGLRGFHPGTPEPEPSQRI